MIFIETKNTFTGLQELVAVAEIRTVGPARKSGETIIRFRTGGYFIAAEPYHTFAGKLPR